MPPILRIFALAAFLPCLSLAASGFTVGGGLNSSFTTDEDEDGVKLSNHTGFNVGLGYEKEITPVFSIMPEINLETRGEEGEFYDEDLDGSIQGEIRFLYLQIPVFALIKFPVGPLTIDLFGGPSLGINLSAEAEFAYGGETLESDIKDETKNVDFGIEVGTGIEFPMGTSVLFVRPSYYAGLTEFADYESPPDTKHRNFKLKLGLKLPL